VIHVEVTIVASTERRAALVQALRSLMLPVQAAPGFIACQLLQDAAEPNVLCYVEDWRTSADLDRQIRSPRYTQLLALMEAAAAPPALRVSWVSDVKGLEYLEAVRFGSPAAGTDPSAN
jgi:quinol monooxygenase YgiN